MLAKQKKTARELAEIIAGRVGVNGVQVAVYKRRRGSGWDANVITAPAQAGNARAMVKEIVAEMRQRYDLKE